MKNYRKETTDSHRWTQKERTVFTCVHLWLICFVLLAASVNAQYRCDWNTFSAGSGNLTSTNYRTQATAGQTAIGNLTSTNILAKIGFWYPLPVIGITEQKDDEITQTNLLITKLYNAYPNPFKSQTAIRYSLSAQSKVSLIVYDVSGRLVRTLINENKPAGIYNLNWDSRNDRNQTVAEGVYFYTLQTDNYRATKKLILTR